MTNDKITRSDVTANELIDIMLEKILTFDFVDHQLMAEGLNELKNIIGLESMKKSILEQVIYTLVNKMDKNIQRKTVLHTLITGNPGLGKTTVARIIGKLLAASGFFQTTITTNNTYNREQLKLKFIGSRMTTLIDNMEPVNKLIRQVEDPETKTILKNFNEHFTDIYNMTESDDVPRVVSPTDSVSNPCGSTEDKMESKTESKTEIKTENEEMKKTETNKKTQPPKKITSIKAKFREVTRDELVGCFQGHTADNVKRIFKEARGGVLFIDEAYSLLNNVTNDDFGQECINLINKLMTDMAHEVIVIFAGYKDKINDILFKNQTGLKSRFLWNFDIQGYTNEELAQIMTKQVTDSGFKFEPTINLPSLLNNNKDMFTNYGRDTEKITTMALIEYSMIRFMNNDTIPLLITNDMLENATAKYKKNRDQEDKGALSMYL